MESYKRLLKYSSPYFLRFFCALILMIFMGIAQNLTPYDRMDFGGPDIGAMGLFGGVFIGLLYGLIIAVGNGIILTGIVILLYNLFAGWLGGIKYKVAIKSESGQQMPPPSSTGGDIQSV